MSWTAELVIEEDHDLDPVDIGIVDEHGDAIYRIPYRETVPLGFLDRDDDEDEEDWC